MFKTINFQPREYQEAILKTAINNNTLVVLPTGLGKSYLFLQLGIHRLNQYPNSKVILVSPTKPLSNQICELFKEHSNVNNITLLTGAISPNKRKELFKSSKVIVGTPQTIQSDFQKKRISLKDVSLLTIDEAHRSRDKYANTIVAREYIEKSDFPRILALTASPGSTKEKIEQIKDNLFIEAIEIRTEEDEDVMKYVQKKDAEIINLELPPIFKKIQELIKTEYKNKVKDLIKIGVTKPASLINKKDLLELQIKLRKQLEKKSQIAFYGISLTAQIIKINHAQELLETQGPRALNNFFEKLSNEETKAAKTIINNPNLILAYILTKKLIEKNVLHPKMNELIKIINNQLNKNPESKIIIFANYRDTIKEIVENLKNIAKPVQLMGQKEGITQKKQIQTIKELQEGKYNCLCTTSIGEEGLSIGTLDLAIFYDNVASSIRRIQRSGRVARVKPGRIIYLITKNTRDAAYYWKSKRDEKTMKDIIKKMQNA